MLVRVCVRLSRGCFCYAVNILHSNRIDGSSQVLFILASRLSGVVPEAIQVNEDNYEAIKGTVTIILLSNYY